MRHIQYVCCRVGPAVTAFLEGFHSFSFEFLSERGGGVDSHSRLFLGLFSFFFPPSKKCEIFCEKRFFCL